MLPATTPALLRALGEERLRTRRRPVPADVWSPPPPDADVIDLTFRAPADTAISA